MRRQMYFKFLKTRNKIKNITIYLTVYVSNASAERSFNVQYLKELKITLENLFQAKKNYALEMTLLLRLIYIQKFFINVIHVILCFIFNKIISTIIIIQLFAWIRVDQRPGIFPLKKFRHYTWGPPNSNLPGAPPSHNAPLIN